MAIVWPVILSVQHNDGDLIGDIVFVRNSVPDSPLDLCVWPFYLEDALAPPEGRARTPINPPGTGCSISRFRCASVSLNSSTAAAAAACLVGASTWPRNCRFHRLRKREARQVRGAVAARMGAGGTGRISHRLARCAGVPLIGIADGGVDGQIEIRALRAERVIAGAPNSSQLCHQPCSPDDDARIKSVVQPGACPHAAGRRLDRHPVPGADAARRRRVRMQFHLRIERALAQARQGAMLALAEQGRLGAGQHQGKRAARSGLRSRADLRFDEVGQRPHSRARGRVSDQNSILRDGVAKPRGIALRVQLGVLGMLCC